MSKSIFKSKIFWVQVLAFTAEVLPIIPLPPGTAAIAGQVLTIILRRYGTTGPVHVAVPNNWE